MNTVVEIQITQEKKIQNKFSSVRAYKLNLRQLRKELKDAFENDKDYHEMSLKVKDEKAKLNGHKQRLEAIPSIAILKEKIQVFKESLESEQLTLSDWLVDYTERTKNDTIPDDLNNIVKIKIKKTAETEEV